MAFFRSLFEAVIRLIAGGDKVQLNEEIPTPSQKSTTPVSKPQTSAPEKTSKDEEASEVTKANARTSREAEKAERREKKRQRKEKQALRVRGRKRKNKKGEIFGRTEPLNPYRR